MADKIRLRYPCPRCKELSLADVGLFGIYKACLNCFRVYREYANGTLKLQKQKRKGAKA